MDSTIQVLEGLSGAPVVAEDVNGLGYYSPGVGAFDLKTFYAAHKGTIIAVGGVVAVALGFMLYKKNKRSIGGARLPFMGLALPPAPRRRRRKARRSRR